MLRCVYCAIREGGPGDCASEGEGRAGGSGEAGGDCGEVQQSGQESSHVRSGQETARQRHGATHGQTGMWSILTVILAMT